ncbi:MULTISPECIES: class I SAM-dependent methyltransferase [unclassified Sphingomonas]|uniref:class I SAM-dependent methyltransferase n=1 Tax=unclassified Sphingomonas TaxID=196159 RepID=UPI0021517F30|nr:MULTISPECIES: class I SAM-dependent methyltransferase [unclassified Sphingomonas]MCR5870305.1 class I SAM-dependent methyltransferase [Sphingomonas sp. J344]UUX98013.1 class I SAM-dependent methyltransferase [Sphingomonas sp. J315]
MDAVYAMQRHIYDATRKYYLLGRDRLIEQLAPPPGGTVLEVGCGTARNLIVASRRWPQAHFFGLDISEAMLATARVKVAKAGLADRITLAQGDATAFDPQALFGRDGFDRVFLSYTLSMIPDWVGAIEQGARALAPGGQLHLVDFGQQERLPHWWRTMLFGWLARFHVTPRRELPVALRHVSREQGREFGFETLLRGYAWAGTIRA